MVHGGSMILMAIDGFLLSRIPIRMKQFILFESLAVLYISWSGEFLGCWNVLLICPMPYADSLLLMVLVFAHTIHLHIKVIHAYSDIGNPYVPEEQSDDAIYATVSTYYYFDELLYVATNSRSHTIFLFIIAAGLEE